MSRKHVRSHRPSAESSSRQRPKICKRNLIWLWVSLGAVLVIVTGALLLKPKAAKSVEISPALAFSKYQQGAFFLDVRSLAEWDQFHISGSTLIPLNQLQGRLAELSKDQDIVVVCLSGHRSQSGVTILQEAGFKQVSCLSGGLQAWTEAGYPVEGKAP